MKSSKQIRSGVNGKSGQEVAKHSFGKTDVRYWCDAIFKPEYRRDGQKLKVEDWAARIQWRGRRETFNLKTSNKAAAAAKAKDIYTTLVGAGWDATLEKFKPEMARKSVSTVGDFLTELRSHWSGKPKPSKITAGAFGKSFQRLSTSKVGARNSITSTAGALLGSPELIESNWQT